MNENIFITKFMQKLLDYYIKKAKEINSKIVYDEIDDERIVESIIELKND
ncbi:MAG: hypothetical protein P1U46_03460 [Patescibacteria group bacterium]|nr:hypothetical protein [Patescibacteria group bacterium]